MRIWTLHPKYLDVRGLTALWREALLARKVLRGETKGYTRHPQLMRFRETMNPEAAMDAYLLEVFRESETRGYHFNGSKIGHHVPMAPVTETLGQLLYEWEHLRRKLAVRSPDAFAKTEGIEIPDTHPLFRVVPGDIRPWEKIPEVTEFVSAILSPTSRRRREP